MVLKYVLHVVHSDIVDFPGMEITTRTDTESVAHWFVGVRQTRVTALGALTPPQRGVMLLYVYHARWSPYVGWYIS